MSDQKFAQGDRVRHATRPEWGIGTIVKVEPLPMLSQNGQHGHTATRAEVGQRLSIRFPNAGVKTLVSGHAELQRVTDAPGPFSANSHQEPSAQAWDKLSGSDWLAPMAKRKLDEAMITLPQEVRDPFNSLQKRLTLTLGLYRFDRSGKGLMDWAVAQTGLDDPLSRFTRHELEERFDRWVCEREGLLAKLLQEARAPGADPKVLSAAVSSAPPAAQSIVRKLIAQR